MKKEKKKKKLPPGNEEEEEEQRNLAHLPWPRSRELARGDENAMAYNSPDKLLSKGKRKIQ